MSNLAEKIRALLKIHRANLDMDEFAEALLNRADRIST